MYRLDKSWIRPNFWVTQALTGHGDFRATLGVTSERLCYPEIRPNPGLVQFILYIIEKSSCGTAVCGKRPLGMPHVRP